MGLTRSFETVQQDESGMLVRSRMPVTVGKHARVRCDLEEPWYRRRKRSEVASPRPREERLLVAAGEEGPKFGRDERNRGTRFEIQRSRVTSQK